MGYAGASQYPDELNPFGDEDDQQEVRLADKKKDEYPDYLSPFGDEDDHTNQNGITIEDYDDSLNPFGDDEQQSRPIESPNNNGQKKSSEQRVVGNPFDEEEEQDVEGEDNQVDKDTFTDELKSHNSIDHQQQGSNPTGNTDNIINAKTRDTDDKEGQLSKSCTPQPDSLEPPKPLPRTKSLLKKEQAFRRRQEQEQQLQQQSSDHNHTSSLQSTTSSTTSSSSLTTNTITVNNNNSASGTVGLFQKSKNKRNAPPVPVNFKRQVPGSLDAIDEELNNIGNKLEIIEKESDLCQETLKARESTDEAEFTTTRNKYIELIKRKGSIMRRQRELMYEKRELKLDQIHSDIEYELRMIGNKQVSNRTTEDEAREKELLKKLVEIVEEKNDIVENLNKISSSDDHDIEEAFRRLNILDCLPQNDNSTLKMATNCSNVAIKQVKNCDKSSSAKFSKIATLLPKSGTIKGTMKPLKHTKRLFKKARDSTKQPQRDQPSFVSLPPAPQRAPESPPPLPPHPTPAPTTTTTTTATEAPTEQPQQDQ